MYRVWYSKTEFDDIETIKEVNEILDYQDVFIISTIEDDDMKVGG